MENLINNILILDNDEKYMVLNQAVYQNKNYFFVVKVTENEEDLLDEFKLLEEVNIDGQNLLQLVTDEKTIDLLTKYFQPTE